MGSVQDFQGRLASFVQSQHIKIYDDQLALASQIWDGLSSEEREVPKVVEYITLGVFQEMDRSTGLESTKKMIHAEVEVDERIIPQIKKMALLRGLDRWQSSGRIVEAKQRIIKAYEEGSANLSLSCLSLTSLPAEIGQLRDLNNLNLSHNQLTGLPAEIGQLRALIHLNLFHNQLTGLPAEIGHLRALTSLDLSYNELTDLPPEIGQLRALIHLNLSCNKLTGLPAEIGQLRDLNNLNLMYNELIDLPAEIGQLRSLTSLDLFENKLTGLPAEIGHLRALTSLNLSYNELTDLLPEIGQLRALTSLYIPNNRLRFLPNSMGLLTNLTHLVLVFNPLRELPLSLGQLHLLTDLNIEQTQISEEVVQRILAQCRAKRDVEASTLLPPKLAAWKAMGESDIDLSLFDPFTDRQKFDLFEWLLRLEKTRDFSNDQKHLAGVVCDILKDVISSREFQEMFFVQVEANNECCEDRAAMSFNEIFVSWKIICLSTNATLKEKLLLLAEAAKTIALRRFLNLAINKREGEERESVEIYLYYELRLQDKLQLLTGIHEMRYGQIGQRDWINEEQIIEYVKNEYFTHLFDIPIFQRLFENDVVTKDRIRKINEFYQAKLEDLPPPKSDAEQLLHQFSLGDIQEERNQARIKLAKEWFDTVINKQDLKRSNLYGLGEWVWEVFKIFRAG